MSNRRVDAKRILTSTPGTFLDVSVSFSAGNTRVNGSVCRGYYVNVGYVYTRDGTELYVGGRGGAGLLETTTRFSQKRMDALVEEARNPFNVPLNMIVERVLAKNNLTLAVSALEQAEAAQAEAEAVCA